MHTTVEQLLQVERASFDAVCAFEVVEHIAAVPHFLDCCAQLVKHQSEDTPGLFFISTLNRTTMAWISAVLAAEYLLQLLPRGTHDFAKFVTPVELQAHLARCGMSSVDLTGIRYNPFNRTACLSNDTSVNFMMCHRKSNAPLQ